MSNFHDRSLLFPELIVFDLDFTLWDCDGTWCDCLRPPFGQRDGRVMDGDGRVVRLHDDVPAILDECDAEGVPMALASRTEQPSWATELVQLLGISDRFAFHEIYPTTKQKHFAALQAASGVAYDRMLFFDDEMRNITEVSELGVVCVPVRFGFSQAVYQAGLRRYRERGSQLS